MGNGKSTQSEQGAEDTPDCDLEIFLIGKTGHGKSATGNAILGRDKFETSNNLESATLKTNVGWTNRDNLTLKVVDGPGLMDTRLKTKPEQLDQMQTNLSEGFLHCPNGFHVLGLVLSYCGRFTEEEKETVAVLKRMLGPKSIKDHCIIIFTHGENFLQDERDTDFKDWCLRQTGDFQNLLNECDNRVILFHNMTPTKREESFKELISMAGKIRQRYTAKLFNEIADERRKYIEEHGCIQLKGPIQSKINMIISCLKRDERDSYLESLVTSLDKEIDKESCQTPLTSATINKIKEGIRQTRNAEYAEARKTFENIEIEGKSSLLQFLGKVKAVVMKFLKF